MKINKEFEQSLREVKEIQDRLKNRDFASIQDEALRSWLSDIKDGDQTARSWFSAVLVSLKNNGYEIKKKGE